MLFYLLVLIPIFTMGVSAFVASLYDYINGDFSLRLLLFSAISIIVTSYIIPRVFFACFKPNTKKQLNFMLKLNCFSKYTLYILLLLFSIVFACKDFDISEEWLPAYLKVSLVFLCLYFIYVYLIYRKKESFKVYDIKRINKKTYLLKLNNDNDEEFKYYIDDESKYEIGKEYHFKYNKNSKIILTECK